MEREGKGWRLKYFSMGKGKRSSFCYKACLNFLCIYVLYVCILEFTHVHYLPSLLAPLGNVYSLSNIAHHHGLLNTELDNYPCIYYTCYWNRKMAKCPTRPSSYVLLLRMVRCYAVHYCRQGGHSRDRMCPGQKLALLKMC